MLCWKKEKRGKRQSSGNEMIPVDSLSRDIFVFRQPFSAAKFNLLLFFFRWWGGERVSAGLLLINLSTARTRQPRIIE